MRSAEILEGHAYPLGATVQDGGVNFALASENAHAVDLCLFDASGVQARRLRLPGATSGVFHGFVPGCQGGTVYGYRVHGPYAPHLGHRFNANKLLLDPYAREIVGTFQWTDAQLGHDPARAHDLHALSEADNAGIALKARVCESAASDVVHVRVPSRDAVFYELHVKGFSKLNQDIPAALRGTYAGLAHPASIAHLKRLGVTSACLLPVHFHIDEAALARRGLTNYWGYNTVGFFCPSPRLASTPDPAAAAQEFRAMVKALHDAGLEVILDVVFNHTAEGDESGPTISFRGIDNAMYYRLLEPDRSQYENLTGCGNTVNVAHPRVTQLVLDSLRYWVQHMGVDGFRFDLAPVLGRTASGFDPRATFFAALAQDPVLAGIKLIAEPWDIGPGGYQLGHFPGRFMEWNDKFRDTTRRFWLHGGTTRGEFARRFMASSDVFHRGHRRPGASVNYVCAHDGYTLRDVVSYARKHNLENGESNRDGRNGEISFNHGAEGWSADATVIQARQRAVRALLASLIMSQGTPILRGGDELGQTQRGNNNAYCQDNEISWIDWAAVDNDLVQYTAHLIALRKRHAVLHQDTWFTGRAAHGNLPDLQWFRADGHLMTIEEWQDASEHAFSALLRSPDPRAPALWLAFNGNAKTTRFALPEGLWQAEIDSSDMLRQEERAQAHIDIAARAIAVLRQLSPEPEFNA